MGGHHLVLGKMVDFLTGVEIEDNHDERYRQKIAKILVEDKKIPKSCVSSRIRMDLRSASGRRGGIWLDFKITLADRVVMIARYGPGSLVTRLTPALALSRLVAPYQVPFVIVTNGEDAIVLDGESGKTLSSGLDSIPDIISLEKTRTSYYFPEIGQRSLEMAEKLAYAYEIDGACPCDENVCRIPD